MRQSSSKTGQLARTSPRARPIHRGTGPLRVTVRATADSEEPFAAEVHAFPGAQATGSTEEEALERGRDLALSVVGERSLRLLEEWLKVAEASGSLGHVAGCTTEKCGQKCLVQATKVLLKGEPALTAGV